mmetsp:Transcript_9013/g.14955  ORF Transcript_9013/g.14955 Transcript_9013/m.14955 type:complete len:485 (-) Transcript_9013:727-2181(-)|eukprot:CAMPEP_0174960232 /NCGR_PEP_ID=MMETSP0004_2-20121128/3598_1 /TAXON_ID=420556 /ORGANISM="Ochromonas sp., Strain CCMP1393" /LENGTH=484 /DNA_ID=CAMNT_0016208599 /DNA_START=94 /DNA_END=1548 /DNA_ORIENTATION=+
MPGPALKKVDIKLSKIDERTSKPPGTARFYRKKGNDGNEQAPLFKNDTFNIATLCQQLLVAGYVQSYVDFYQLTHRVDPSSLEEAGMSQIQISEEDTVFIRDNLVKAEVSRRQGDTANVYAAFNQLADYYVKNQDWKTSFFFHEKCLEVSQLTNDVRAEMSANHSLGSIYQLMNDFSRARPYHERHEDIAASLDVFEEVAKSNVELYKVYLVLAGKCEEQGQFDDALDLYNQCLESAKKSWDKSAEADANGKIGNLLLSKGDAQRSLPYLKQQAQISADLGNAEGRCRACSALALALDSMGQSDKALNELMMVVSISDDVGDSYLQAQACRALGTLYSKLGRLTEAVEILQRHFNLLKKLLYKSPGGQNSNSSNGGGSGDASDAGHTVTSQDLDMARAYIGISKGNLMLGTYTLTMQSNIGALLDWKLNRTEIPRSSLPPETTTATSQSMVGANNPVDTSKEEAEKLEETLANVESQASDVSEN